MIETKKARSVVGATERVSGQESSGVASPLCNSITGRSQVQGVVESTLLHGEENALSAVELISILGLKNTRELRLMVASERDKGALILTSEKGYFLPKTGSAGRLEIQAFVLRMESAAWNTHKAAQPARKALNNLDGQFSLCDV